MAWFEKNYIKVNSDECNLLLSVNKSEQVQAQIREHKIWETRTLKLLDITIDNNLKFDEHLSNIRMTVNRKLTALTRVRKYPDFDKTWILFKAFFESQFKYCPLT